MPTKAKVNEDDPLYKDYLRAVQKGDKETAHVLGTRANRKSLERALEQFEKRKCSICP